MPQVNPEILRWARESAGLSADEAASKLGLGAARGVQPVERLLALEEGRDSPTRAMLSRMAKQYRRPLVAFYLEEPPPKGERGTDFRTLSTPRVIGDEALVDALIRRLIARQDLLRSALVDDDAKPLSFVGSVSRSDGVPGVVSALRNALGLSLDTFRAANGKDAAFRLLRVHADNLGIFVLQIGNLGSHHTDIGVEAFRGATLADRIAPFVVINSNDAAGARCFTLLHELAHLWLGHTGVSGGVPRGPVERFCNDVASEYLLPAAEFVRPQVTDETAPTAWTKAIGRYAAELNVSSTMVAYRLFRAGHIGETLWLRLHRHYRSQWISTRDRQREKMKRQDGGPGYYRLQRNRLGTNLVESTARLMASGALTTTKAGRILGVRPKIVHALVAGS